MWLYEKPVAHRGLHDAEAPENSMAAFRKAIEKGYHIETDVHLLKSGEVAVFHDDNLKRICGKNAKIKDLTLDDVNGDEYLLPNGEHIPLFSDFLDLVNGQVGILLELKYAGLGNYELEKKVLDLIAGKEDWIAVQAFNPYTIAWFAENAPQFRRGLLSLWAIGFDVGMYWRRMKPDFISFEASGLGLIKKYVAKRNARLLSWTNDSREKVEKSIKNGVNNIIFENIDLDEIGFDMSKLNPNIP